MSMKKIFYEGNQIHIFMSSSGPGTDFLTSYGSGSGSGSTSQKVTVPTGPVPVPVPQHWVVCNENRDALDKSLVGLMLHIILRRWTFLCPCN
jgi:hypothetical protein